MKRYVVVVEKADGNYSAYLPDVDGCIATGDTIEDTVELLQEALAAHFKLMADDGQDTPEPTTEPAYVDVDVPQPASRKAS
jgi:predicted RNase H-like HicB family nuclease